MNADAQARRNWSTLLLAWAAYFFAVCALIALFSRAWSVAMIIALWAAAGLFATYGRGTFANILCWVFWFGVAGLLVTGIVELYLH